MSSVISKNVLKYWKKKKKKQNTMGPVPIARSFKAYFYIQNLKNYPLTWKQG